MFWQCAYLEYSVYNKQNKTRFYNRPVKIPNSAGLKCCGGNSGDPPKSWLEVIIAVLHMKRKDSVLAIKSLMCGLQIFKHLFNTIILLNIYII